jgi:two-component system OmpR family response regulator
MESKKLLVVDDSDDVTYLIRTIMEFHGYDVRSCSDAETAFRQLESEKFDVLISDYMMEPVNGIELIQKIRSSKEISGLKIVLLTFRDLNEEELHLLNHLDSGYLKKPFNPDEVIQKVETTQG